jgi:hypothetical protein
LEKISQIYLRRNKGYLSHEAGNLKNTQFAQLDEVGIEKILPSADCNGPQAKTAPRSRGLGGGQEPVGAKRSTRAFERATA